MDAVAIVLALFVFALMFGLMKASAWWSDGPRPGGAAVFRVLRIDPEREQDWKQYGGTTVLVFSALF
jgi:hypothetical protein